MKIKSILTLFIFFALSSFSQDQTAIDSLNLELKKVNPDTTRVNILNQLSWELIGSSPAEAHDYSLQAWRLASEIGFKKGIAISLYNRGNNYFRQSDYVNALLMMKQAAIAFEEVGNLRGLAASYNIIGSVYYEIKYYNKALEYQAKGLAIQKKIKSQKSISVSYNNIGNVYCSLEEYGKARIYYDSALSIHEEIKDSLSLALCYNNLGIISKNMHDTAQALRYYSKSVLIKERIGNKQGLSITLYNIGSLYMYQKSYSLAREYFLRSLKFAEAAHSPDDIKNAYKGLADICEYKGEYADAFKYYKRYAEIKDSIFNAETQKQIIDVQDKYETEKKEHLISLQKSEIEKQDIRIEKQQFQLLGLIVGIVLLLLLSLAIYSGYNRKKKANVLIGKEKQRSEDLLLNILPAEVAFELKKYGKSHAKKIELVSVLFADFKNFTLFAEKVRPEELIDELDFCFRGFDGIISKYNIEKIKTIGDSYMCAGGIPLPNKTNPVDVVSCAIEMLDFMEDYKANKVRDQEPYLEARIGINTGPVVAGVVGAKKFAYDIWGDTVNIASRIEAAGQVGKINISGETYQYVKDSFTCEYRGKIEAKNKGEIDMYFVISKI